MYLLAGCLAIIGILIAGMPIYYFLKSIKEADEEWTEENMEEKPPYGWVNITLSLVLCAMSVGLIIEEASTPETMKHPPGSRFNPIILKDSVLVTAKREPIENKEEWRAWFSPQTEMVSSKADSSKKRNVGGAEK